MAGRKKRWMKYFTIWIVAGLMMILASVSVLGDEQKYDGLSVSVSIENQKYTIEDEVTATITVINTNKKDLTGIEVDSFIPRGMKLKNGESNVIIGKLKPQESKTIGLVLVWDDYSIPDVPGLGEYDSSRYEEERVDPDPVNPVEDDSNVSEQEPPSESEGDTDSEIVDQEQQDTSDQKTEQDENGGGDELPGQEPEPTVKPTPTQKPGSSIIYTDHSKDDKEKEEKKPSVVQRIGQWVNTGDTTSLLKWIAIFVVVVVILIILIILFFRGGGSGRSSKRRRKNTRRNNSRRKSARRTLSVLLAVSLGLGANASVQHVWAAPVNSRLEPSEEETDMEPLDSVTDTEEGRESSDSQEQEADEEEQTAQNWDDYDVAGDFYAYEAFYVEGKMMLLTVKVQYGDVSKGDFSIDTAAFVLDETDDTYYAFDAVDGIGGNMVNASHAEAAEWLEVNDKGDKIGEGAVEPGDSWFINEIGFVAGVNQFAMTVWFDTKVRVTRSVLINNVNPDNVEGLNLDMNDDDDDGLLNYIEDYYRTDPMNADTDGDGLTDFEEINLFGTDPLIADMDSNGVKDGDEDFDADFSTNLQELINGTDPLNADTDCDELLDGEEESIGTNPLNYDTDGDGAADGWEYVNGFDPLVYDSTFEVQAYAQDPDQTVSVVTELEGEAADTLSVTPSEDPRFNNSIPGYMGLAYDLSANADVTSATLTISFNESYLAEEDMDPVIYYFNEETQGLEQLETVVNGNVATAELSHFSTYLLLNRTKFDEVWEREIKVGNTTVDSNGTITKSSLDVAFAIDYSASMDDNDPNYVRRELTKAFIDKLKPNVDHASVTKFAAYATTLIPLSDDKAMLCNAVDQIVNTSSDSCGNDEAGTNGVDGIRKALDTLDTSTADFKYIIFLTDGDDTITDSNWTYDELIAEARAKNVVIFTIGLGEANEEQLRSIAGKTGGKYYYGSAGYLEEEDEQGEGVQDLTDIFGEIEDETINWEEDSNHDGISDYYTRLMVTGELRSGTGAHLFQGYTFEEIQASVDLDGDGLMNGDELKITRGEDGHVYMKILSFPERLDSDRDGFDDYEEREVYGTDALKANSILWKPDVDYVTDSENFISDKYKDFWDNKYIGWAEKGGVMIGNALYNSEFVMKKLYQSALIDYFAQMENAESDMFKDVVDFTDSILGTVGSAVSYYTDVHETVPDVLINLRNYAESLERGMRNSSGNGFASRDDFYRYVDDLFEQYSKATEEIEVLEKELKVYKYMKVADTIGNVASAFVLVYQVYDTYRADTEEFNKYVESLETMQNRVYILDEIAREATDQDLRDAAAELRDIMYSDLSDGVKTFFEHPDFGHTIYVSGGKLAHFVMGFIPGVKWVEAGIAITDFVFKISDVSKECAKLYGISTAADITSNSFQQYMNTHAGLLADYYWRDYRQPATSLEKISDLAMMRYSAEKQMQKADYANSFLLEWLFRDHIYNVDDCEANKIIMNRYVGYYNFQRSRF